MKFVHTGLIVILCIVIEIDSERIRSGLCSGCHREQYTRIKRAKYYSNPPLKFYNRPPMTFPIKGAYSLTPPPGWMDDDRQPNVRPKVSMRPPIEAVRDSDINNIMQFLSKQDLDKLMEFAKENESESQKHSVASFESDNYINKAEEYDNDVSYEYNPELENNNMFLWNKPSVNGNQNFRPYNLDYNYFNKNEDTKNLRFPEIEPSALFVNEDKSALNLLNDPNVMKDQRLSTLNYKQQVNGHQNGDNIFTDSSIIQEEQLPKPSNLREDDFDVSYTNNVPTVVKPNTGSYKIENLGELPLMNYHSKLDTVDSYRVPHYTVTSDKYGGVPSNTKVPVEPAPPASVAKEQSDAHLKAIKIWTHRSKGTAYILHDDGTLSLEKPSRTKANNYG